MPWELFFILAFCSARTIFAVVHWIESSPLTNWDARRAGYEMFGPFDYTPPLAKVSSEVALNGEIRREWQCSSPHFAIGFELRALEPQGVLWDDVAATNMILQCGYTESLLGDGEDVGVWTGPQNCLNTVICGIQTQVEYGKLDDTALNNVKFGCCEPV
ncbi:unnamed protein product [Allacma fusca]|uniref:Vitelline membrane outer layer protein 1 homolog n=1 Tax=Allacma fusca TaxID=39272 RepID=A0A8J2NLX6_9HEXA|nr:unnamed protein product [Allacma fusca]